jgi:hypothetical protein
MKKQEITLATLKKMSDGDEATILSVLYGADPPKHGRIDWGRVNALIKELRESKATPNIVHNGVEYRVDRAFYEMTTIHYHDLMQTVKSDYDEPLQRVCDMCALLYLPPTQSYGDYQAVVESWRERRELVWEWPAAACFGAVNFFFGVALTLCVSGPTSSPTPKTAPQP